MSPTTIRDVAKKANVGIGTVSRVLNNSSAVSQETRERVLNAIQELDYIPNPIARQLSTGRTTSIGVILPYLTMPSYVERLRGVQKALADTEYDLILFSVDTPGQRDKYFEELSRTARVDGMLIISLPPDDKQAKRFASSHIPAVFIDAYHPQINCIVTDDFTGGKTVTEYFLSLGHYKIAYLSDYLDTPFHPSMRYRYKGLQEALANAGVEFCPQYLVEGKNERGVAKELAKQLLTLPDPPTAIFAGCDVQAIGVLDAARELGVSVPEHLSVIGYDNIRDAEYVNLTTIEQHLTDSGTEGAHLLLETLAATPKIPQTRNIPIELVIRGTTAPPKA